MREDDNDLAYEADFFKTRGKVKSPRRFVPLSPVTTDLIGQAKKPRRTKKFAKGNAYQHTKTGARQDLGGIVARSAWEADVMRILVFHKIDFLFEPREFQFPADARGRTHAYLPDIWLSKTDEYIEVKGYLDPRGRNKLRKFKKHYPEDFKKLTVVISKSNKANKFFFKKLGVERVLYYEHLTKLYGNKILTWEGKH